MSGAWGSMNRGEAERAERHLLELATTSSKLDPLPIATFEAAVASFARRSTDTELADLVFDSASTREGLVEMRSTGIARQLTFETPDLVIELMVDDSAECPLVGKLVPECTAEIELRSGAATVTVRADERGRFWAPNLPSRVVSLRITRPNHENESVTTPWVSLVSGAARRPSRSVYGNAPN
jgi:hypothetical protein